VRGGVRLVLRSASRIACRDRQWRPRGSRKCAASYSSFETSTFRRRIPWGEGGPKGRMRGPSFAQGLSRPSPVRPNDLQPRHRGCIGR
jgi:hypothetical protein